MPNKNGYFDTDNRQLTDVFRELQRLKVTHSISMSLFVNNATRKAIEELKKEIKKNEN